MVAEGHHEEEVETQDDEEAQGAVDESGEDEVVDDKEEEEDEDDAVNELITSGQKKLKASVKQVIICIVSSRYGRFICAQVGNKLKLCYL